MPRKKLEKPLAARIRERQKFIEKVHAFAEPLCKKHGTSYDNVEHKFHCSGKQKLEDFGRFSFFYRYGLSLMGGSEFSVLFRKNPESPHTPVLVVSWDASIKQCTVATFNEQADWQLALKGAMYNKKSILADMKAKQEADKQLVERHKQRLAAAAELKREAGRLGFQV